MKSKEYSSSLSYLRLFATIMIVASHTWSTLQENKELFSLTVTESTFLEIAYSLTKWAVPVFFMITGALLLKKDKKISVRDCICKYSKRMMLALVIFGIPYAFLKIYSDNKQFTLSIIPKSIIDVISGNNIGHLWYLYTLIGLYLFLPLIKLFVNNATKREFRYILILIFIFNYCFPLIYSITGFDIGIKVPFITYPLFYMLMGYYIYNEKPWWQDKTWMVVLGVVISAIIIIVSGIMGLPLATIMAYHSPVAALFALSIFIAFQRIEKTSTEMLWVLDRLCFGVYLIHPLFIQFCYRFLNIVPTGNSLYPILSMIFAAVFIVISFIASWIMSLIKPLKKYVL